MTNWIICALIVSLCVSIVVHRSQRLQIEHLRRRLRDAIDPMEPIVIGEPADED